jgi:predicted DsbA family dithiol-disulfide isomerase
MIKIQVWSDFVCPFCYISKRNLELAIEETGRNVEIELMSYELDPNCDDSSSLSIAEVVAKKYDMSIESAKRNNERIRQLAESSGIFFKFDTMKQANSRNAHRIFQYAKSVGKDKKFAEILFDAYFENGIHINNKRYLVGLALLAGLNETKTKEIIESDLFNELVDRDIELAKKYSINKVPYFIIDDKIHLSGTQTVSEFINILNRINEKDYGGFIQTAEFC